MFQKYLYVLVAAGFSLRSGYPDYPLGTPASSECSLFLLRDFRKLKLPATFYRTKDASVGRASMPAA
jgi:hypothetical protein